MIKRFCFPIFILFLLKDSLFLSRHFFIDKNIFRLIFIFPLVLLIIGLCFFTSSSLFYFNSYHFIFFFITLFLFLCFCSNSAYLFLLFLERCVFLIILLIFNFSKDSDKFSSVSFMFIMNSIGSIPFIYFCSSCKSVMLNFDLGLGRFSSLWLLFSCYLILVSKIPLFFFHFWLTKAHVRARGSGSIILARLMLKIGTLGIFKFCPFFLFFSIKSSFSFLCSVSIFRCLGLSLVMTRFFDLKYIVACSSILHMSIIFPASFMPNSLSILASLMMMVGHGIVSCFIFLLVRVLYEIALNRSSDSRKRMERSRTIFSAILYIFFLFNLGFPPFVRFMREFIFVSVLLKISHFLLSLFCLSLILVGFVFILVILMFLFGKYMKKTLGKGDKLLRSRFFYFFLYFRPVIIIFN